MKKIPNWIIIILALSVIIASKFIFFSKEVQSKGSQSGKPATLSVHYYVVKALPYENHIFSAGKTGAFNEVNLMPELAGKVTGIYFKEGQYVNKGELMVKLNDADFQAQLLKVNTQLKLAEQKLDRLKKLREINGVSEEEYEMQENEIAVLRADEKFYQAQIAKTSIVAPFAGMVGLKNVSEGAFVSTNTGLVSLVQLNPLYIEFSIPGKYNPDIKNGMSITFELENDLGAQTYTAQIYAIEPKMDEATKTIRLRAEYKGDKTLLPGTYVKVYVGFGDNSKQLMVPSQSIIPILKGHKVFRFSAGKAIETPVKIGPRSDQKVLVLEGLSEGDTIITTGLMSIKKDLQLNLIKSAD
ncbi:MAG: efflux RND transporter periplasmic adaptor subunit [Bacteroidia bacterium]|jgi:membrane fusion protein (multidrug efflux system)|nr:efflux RND transporter periplasmic adaptor subunit [Bacteroidia bacterium]